MDEVFQTLKQYYAPGTGPQSPPLSPHGEDPSKAKVSVVSPRSSMRTSPLPSPSRSVTTTLLNAPSTWGNVANPFAAALFNTIKLHGSKAAILYPSLANAEVTSTISWNEFGIAASRVGRALHVLNKGAQQKRKVGKRDAFVAVLLLANSKESIMLHMGSLLTGVVPIALDPTDPAEKLRGLLQQLEPAVLFIDTVNQLELLSGLSFIKRVVVCDPTIPTGASATSTPEPPHLPEGVLLYETFLRDGQKVSDEDAQQLTMQGSKMDEPALISACRMPRGASSTGDSLMVFPNSILYSTAKAIARSAQITETDSVSCLLPLSDLSQTIFGILVPLMTGASVYVTHALWADGVTRELPLCPSVLALDSVSWEQVFKALGLRVAATGQPRQHGALYKQLSGLENCRGIVSLWGQVNPIVRSYFEDYYEIGVCEFNGPVELAGVAFIRPAESKGSNPAWQLSEGILLRSEKSGDLQLRSEQQIGFPYKTVPESNPIRAGEYFASGDVGLLTEPNKLVLNGKREDLANLGGTDVSLSQIDGLLRMLPAVSAAVTHVTSDQRKLVAVLSLDKSVVAAIARKLEIAPDMLWAAPEMLREVLQTELQLLNSKPPFRGLLHQFTLLAPGEYPKLEEALYEPHSRPAEARAICKEAIGAQLKALESSAALTKLSQTDELEQSLSNSQSLRRSSSKKKRYNTGARSSADSSLSTPPSSPAPSAANTPQKNAPNASAAATKAALDREELSKQIAQAKEADPVEIRRTGSSILRLARKKETEDAQLEKQQTAAAAAFAVSGATPSVTSAGTSPAALTRPASSTSAAQALVASSEVSTSRRAVSVRSVAAPQYRQSPRQSDSEIRSWVEGVLDMDHDEAVSFPALLRDGIVLCKLANELQPGSVSRFNMMKGTFFHLENINFFISFAKKAGVSKFDLFDAKDLTEEKGNFEKVLITLDILHKLTTNQQQPAP